MQQNTKGNNLMRKNKKSFTLTEVLLSMAIIGFVLAMSMSTIKIVKSSYTALTYFAFKNIQNMVGETFAGSLPHESLLNKDGSRMPYPLTRCIYEKYTDRGVAINVLISDYEYGESEQRGLPECSARGNLQENSTNIFCKALAGILNVSGPVNCDNLYESRLDDNGEPEIVLSNVYENNVPNFITTNGQRYYISYWTMNDNVSNDFGYRVIAVDLNGKSRPNTQYATSKNVPDIVSFLVLDNGEVLPLGVAADNLQMGTKKVQYLTSQVKGYYYSHNPNRKDHVPSECFKKINGETKQYCNYAVVYLTQKNEDDKEVSFFTYREAYCNALGYSRYPTFRRYCSGVTKTPFCPPSNDSQKFDLCKVENVKPLFRYNFK